jgi:hypothetical protein
VKKVKEFALLSEKGGTTLLAVIYKTVLVVTLSGIYKQMFYR